MNAARDEHFSETVLAKLIPIHSRDLSNAAGGGIISKNDTVCAGSTSSGNVSSSVNFGFWALNDACDVVLGVKL